MVKINPKTLSRKTVKAGGALSTAAACIALMFALNPQLGGAGMNEYFIGLFMSTAEKVLTVSVAAAVIVDFFLQKK